MRLALLATITLAALAPIIWLTINELHRQHRFKHIRAARQRDYDDRLNTDRFMANYGIAELERYRQAIKRAGVWDEFNEAYNELNGNLTPDESPTNP